MKSWTTYTAVSAAVVVAAGLLVGFWLEPAERGGLWAGLAAALVVQAAAFGILIAVVRRGASMLAGWTVGSLLRLGVLATLAWLTLSGIWSAPPAPTLLALVGGIFALLLLEPVFFRRATEVG